MNARRIVIADTETVTLDASTGLIWEIGLLDRTPKGDVEYLWHLRPDLTDADPGSVRFSDYYNRCAVADRDPGTAMVIEHPKLAKGKRQVTQSRKVAFEVAKLIAGAVLVGAVPDFDSRMFTAWLRSHKECNAAHYHLQDVETLVWGYLLGLRAAGLDVDMPPLPLKSDALSLALGIDPALFKRHKALGDCYWVRAQLDKVLGGAS